MNGTPSRVLRHFAKHLDGAIRRGEFLEQLGVVLQALHWVGEKLAEPSRILRFRLRHIAHTHFEVFAIGVYSSDHDLVAENKFEIDPVRRNLDHLVSARDAREYQHSVLAERLHTVEYHG